MKSKTISVLVVPAVLLVAAILIVAISTGLRAGTHLPHTPARGSAERKAILDALREEVQRLHHIRVIFVVPYMKVQQGWAWVHVRPQSPDGKNRYEDILALIHKGDNRWKVVEMPSMEEDNLDYVGSSAYFKSLKKKFPGVPTAIFPSPNTY